MVIVAHGGRRSGTRRETGGESGFMVRTSLSPVWSGPWRMRHAVSQTRVYDRHVALVAERNRTADAPVRRAPASSQAGRQTVPARSPAPAQPAPVRVIITGVHVIRSTRPRPALHRPGGGESNSALALLPRSLRSPGQHNRTGARAGGPAEARSALPGRRRCPAPATSTATSSASDAVAIS